MGRHQVALPWLGKNQLLLPRVSPDLTVGGKRPSRAPCAPSRRSQRALSTGRAVLAAMGWIQDQCCSLDFNSLARNQIPATPLLSFVRSWCKMK